MFTFIVAFVMGLLSNEVFSSPIVLVLDCKMFSFVLQLMLISQEVQLQAAKKTKFQNQSGRINHLTRTKIKTKNRTRTRTRRRKKKKRKRTKAKRKTKVRTRTIRNPARVLVKAAIVHLQRSNLLMRSAVTVRKDSVKREPKRSESSVNASDRTD